VESVKLTKKQARQFILLKQGLIGDYQFIEEEGVCRYIKQAGCIQFDPIDSCGKNAELVLQSRVKGFDKELLDKLLYEDRKLIDYFDKNMSIVSVEDWKYFSRQRAFYCQQSRSRDQVGAVTDKVKSVIKTRGFVSSKDIDLKDINLKEQVDWVWSPTTLARAALETMYCRGDLIIHHKKGTIKHYGLSSEYIPDEILNATDPHLTQDEYREWSILRRIGAVGMLWNRPSDAWLGIDDLKAANRNTVFEKLFREHKIIEILIESIPDVFYCLSQDAPLIERVVNGNELIGRTEFIAALDNILWDRKLIKKIFEFDYKWEIYTPVVERKYGYYVLPVLSGDSFIGRIEAVNDKKLKQLIVKNFWFEENMAYKDRPNVKIHDCLERFARFNKCENIKLECEIG
jgi:uncharacterized protein YcaQ